MYVQLIVVFLLLFVVRPANLKVVNTTHGLVRGSTVSVMGKSLDIFQGIPFAKPPIGELRFKYPEVMEPWKGTLKAEDVPQPCVQPAFPTDFTEDYRQFSTNTSEDCLYLTVNSPSNNAGNLPVMVWIHGGGFIIGSISVPLTDGRILSSENDVIMVSMQYRLGPLGFMYLGPDTIPGNMGMMDQVMALKWVQENIRNFGGDPNKVTIFGESAGAGAVGLHLLSPLSGKLFNRAIMESGSPTAAWSFLPAATVREKSLKLSASLQCDGSNADMLSCLRRADPQKITDGLFLLMAEGIAFVPTVDGHFLKDDPVSLLKKGAYKKTQILHGINKDEATIMIGPMLKGLLNVSSIPKVYTPTDDQYTLMTTRSVITQQPYPESLQLFYTSMVNPDDNVTRLDAMIRINSDSSFGCPAVELGSVYAQTNSVYMYVFDHVSSQFSMPHWMGSTHSFEMEFAFGFALNQSVGFTEAERDLAKTMVTYWTNFAKTGDPNKPVSVKQQWPTFEETRMRYQLLGTGSNLATKQSLLRHECTFINKILPMIPSEHRATRPPTLLCVGQGSRLTAGVIGLLLPLLIVFH